MAEFNKGEHFFEQGFQKAHTVVFFTDIEGGRIGMLRRADSLTFAPGLYTGVGGKIEKNESHIEGAIRELEEELEGYSYEGGIKEFGRLIINNRNILCYFVLPWEKDLPRAQHGIGDLHWASQKDVFDLNIIPTTKVFMEKWAARHWETGQAFTVLVEREDADNPASKVISASIVDGLLSHPENKI